MPFTLPPISRRRFLTATAAAGLSIASRRLLGAATLPATRPAADQHRFALLSDTHIFKDKDKVAREVNMYNNLRQVTAEVLAANPAPAAVLLSGDCAFHAGHAEDYATFLDALAPVREALLPIHLTLGNHDNRQRFLDAIPADDSRQKSVEHRLALIVKSPRANWFILDSLDEDSAISGNVGDEQLAWLDKALAANADKPALVMIHHQPDDGLVITGLTDTRPLLDLLLARKHVKALFFGHTHDWHHEERDGLHLVNLPPVAYVFTPGKPNGWIDATLTEKGATLHLHTLDPAHPDANTKINLNWRNDT